MRAEEADTRRHPKTVFSVRYLCVCLNVIGAKRVQQGTRCERARVILGRCGSAPLRTKVDREREWGSTLRHLLKSLTTVRHERRDLAHVLLGQRCWIERSSGGIYERRTSRGEVSSVACVRHFPHSVDTVFPDCGRVLQGGELFISRNFENGELLGEDKNVKDKFLELDSIWFQRLDQSKDGSIVCELQFNVHTLVILPVRKSVSCG